ncbi:hypothetical protein vBKpMFBKp34_145 [Klebsiella phage vB_KpM_FBKp34]|nr:hypothetical protein vBKpMFBKp34_145 [Klebsiella phage vB_KpM_FBKp34]
MTDITELAQSLKAAADREMICRDGAETSEIWERTVTPENILALVEALEKAQADHRLHAARLISEKALLNERIAELESRTVTLPKPKDSDPGWKIDPEFISKVQNAIGYDDQCECWEGTPSMEVVEAVLLAAAGIKVEAE